MMRILIRSASWRPTACFQYYLNTPLIDLELKEGLIKSEYIFSTNRLLIDDQSVYKTDDRL